MKDNESILWLEVREKGTETYQDLPTKLLELLTHDSCRPRSAEVQRSSNGVDVKVEKVRGFYASSPRDRGNLPRYRLPFVELRSTEGEPWINLREVSIVAHIKYGSFN